jgi:hypothetical protein
VPISTLQLSYISSVIPPLNCFILLRFLLFPLIQLFSCMNLETHSFWPFILLGLGGEWRQLFSSPFMIDFRYWAYQVFILKFNLWYKKIRERHFMLETLWCKPTRSVWCS